MKVFSLKHRFAILLLLAVLNCFSHLRAQANDSNSLIGKPLPEFRGITAWINSGPTTTHALRGKVVLVEFWTFDCINCKHTLPHLVAWDAAYRKQGLAIVGVHTPELAYERNLDNVKSAVTERHITYPVAFDPQYKTWQAYGNDAWPHIYLSDRKGIIRYEVVGEGAYDETEAEIRRLLAER